MTLDNLLDWPASPSNPAGSLFREGMPLEMGEPIGWHLAVLAFQPGEID